MNRLLNQLKTIVCVALCLCAVETFGAKTALTVQPAHWWAGMKQPSLQLLLRGEALKDAKVKVVGQGIDIERVVYPDNPHYALVYLNVARAPAQTFRLEIEKGKKTLRIPYTLKTRDKQTKAQGFTAADVIYLLMPDRFANGNPANDVVKGMLEQKSDRKDDFGRHGGDLQGVIGHLDYLNDLGVTTLWLNPIQENNMPQGSYHGYAITDYYQVDPRLGTPDEFKTLVAKVHEKGLKVVMDMVFNHCGSENSLFTDRPADDWFNYGSKYVQTTFKTASVADTHASGYDRKLAVDGWFTESMPDWNQRNLDVATYLIQNSIWWIEETGIDGIRQDTHPYADFDFMARWCRTVRTEYPSFNIVGETWLNSNTQIAWWQKDSRLAAPRNSQLPTVMDFPLFSRMGNAFEEETGEWNGGLFQLYDYLSQDFVFEQPLNLLVFLDNHDTSRFFRNEKDTDNWLRYKQALTFLLTVRGIPQIYYGMEIGMFADKQEGDGKLRQDFPGGWSADTRSAFVPEGRTDKENRIYALTRKLLQWRKRQPALATGKMVHFTIMDGVYVYARMNAEQTIVVMMNGTSQAKNISAAPYAEVLKASQATDFFTGEISRFAEGISIPAHDVRMFCF